MKFNSESFVITDTGKILRLFLMVGVAGLLLSLVGLIFNPSAFFHSYLTSVIFWTSIGLGALFMVMLHYLVNAVWSVVIRRVLENILITLPVMGLLFIPVLFGIPYLYSWNDNYESPSHSENHAISIVSDAYAEETVIEDDSEHEDVGTQTDPHKELLEKKKAFLNTPFFIIRTIIYFLIWSLIAVRIYKNSLKQDRDGASDANDGAGLRISAPGMILFALTVSFAGFDWMMSLDPLWYSTIYGVYFFSGCIVSVMAFVSVFSTWLRGKNILADIISEEHYHTIGKLLFGFVIFWAYMAFSQYLLIWYANIPEETIWYHHRWVGGWKFISVLIAVAHFTIPFIFLMPKNMKRNPKILSFWAIWILVMHWVDLYWNIQPNLYPDGAGFSWMDVTSMIGIGSIFLYFFWKNLSKNPILTLKDRKLGKSVNYVN